MTRWMAIWGVAAALAGILSACGPKNDCQRLAELTCRTEGTSPKDCRTARKAAKEARTEAQFEACRRLLQVYQSAETGNP